MRSSRLASMLALALLGVGLGGFLSTSLSTADECPAPVPCPAPPAAPVPAAAGQDLGRMHNVHKITPHFVRGSQPEVEDDFRLLAGLGVKVVVSVDGARPQVELARKHGLRYVHVPIGYGGMTRAQVVTLYKAFSTLQGPFYVHCHHGKHRGPAACAVGLMGVDGWTAEQAVAELKVAGTAAKYDGLYAVPRTFTRPSAEELTAAPAELPEVAAIPPFQEAMVEIDHGFERLTAVRKAAWKAPADHPDVAPFHEATIFAQYLRELARRDEVAGAEEGFRTLLGASETAAWDLAKALEAKPVDGTLAESAFDRLQKSCTACHVAHRDGAASSHGPNAR